MMWFKLLILSIFLFKFEVFCAVSNLKKINLQKNKSINFQTQILNVYKKPELLSDSKSVNVSWDVSMYENASNNNLMSFKVIPALRLVFLRDVNNVSVGY